MAARGEIKVGGLVVWMLGTLVLPRLKRGESRHVFLFPYTSAYLPHDDALISNHLKKICYFSSSVSSFALIIHSSSHALNTIST